MSAASIAYFMLHVYVIYSNYYNNNNNNNNYYYYYYYSSLATMQW